MKNKEKIDLRPMIKEISNFYGLDKQLNQQIEESSELIFAISKYKRYINTPDSKKWLANIKEELADNIIVMHELIDLLDCKRLINKTIGRKVTREMERISIMKEDNEIFGRTEK